MPCSCCFLAEYVLVEETHSKQIWKWCGYGISSLDFEFCPLDNLSSGLSFIFTHHDIACIVSTFTGHSREQSPKQLYSRNVPGTTYTSKVIGPAPFLMDNVFVVYTKILFSASTIGRINYASTFLFHVSSICILPAFSNQSPIVTQSNCQAALVQCALPLEIQVIPIKHQLHVPQPPHDLGHPFQGDATATIWIQPKEHVWIEDVQTSFHCMPWLLAGAPSPWHLFVTCEGLEI